MKRRWRIGTGVVGAVVFLVMLTPYGCRQSAVWRADWATKPVIREIEAYAKKTGNLPVSLQQLNNVTGGKLKLKNEGYYVVWSITYRVREDGGYIVDYHHAHYDVRYRDGERISTRFNYFR